MADYGFVVSVISLLCPQGNTSQCGKGHIFLAPLLCRLFAQADREGAHQRYQQS